MEPVTVTPISQRRRQHLSDRLVELNKEFEDSTKNDSDDIDNNNSTTNDYLLDQSSLICPGPSSSPKNQKIYVS